MSEFEIGNAVKCDASVIEDDRPFVKAAAERGDTAYVSDTMRRRPDWIEITYNLDPSEHGDNGRGIAGEIQVPVSAVTRAG